MEGKMKVSDIHIRDPFVLLYDGKYYMYGTRGSESFSEHATGLDVFVSADLENWEGPFEVFKRKKDFWATRDFWAPEVHIYNDRFYMFVSMKSCTKHRGTQILVSDNPKGPFEPISEEPITPRDWECLDGTLYVDEEHKPYIIFCREWTQTGNGEVYSVRLSDDLRIPIETPNLLWKASDYKGAINIAENPEIESKVTDGPFIYKSSNGELLSIWSTMNSKGYCELISKSDNGKISGKWQVEQKPLFEGDGGHGMLFRDKEERLMFVMHYPNVRGEERAKFVTIKNLDEEIVLKKEVNCND